MEDKNYGGEVCTLAVGTVIEGSLELKSNLRLEGKVTGEVHCEGRLIMSKNGLIKGDIHCGSLITEGEIEGNVKSEHRIELKASSRLTGNVECSSIEIDNGAIFNGQCSMHRKEG